MAKQSTAPGTLPKPRVKMISATQIAISHRGQRGHVYRDEKTGRWHAFRYITETNLESMYRVMWRAEEAFDVLVDRLNEVADCRDAAVQVDELESKGLRSRLADLGGDAALAAFDVALAKMQRDDASGLSTVRGMLKVAVARKLPKAVSFMTGEGRTMRNVTIIPGFSIRVNELTYYIGGRAEYGSYNLHYFGEIKHITAKTITVSQDDTGRSKARRLSVAEFAWRNDSDIASKSERNADTMQYI